MDTLVLDEGHLQLARLVYQETLTAQQQPSKAMVLEALPCTGTLAKVLGLKLEAVKKRLQILRLLGLVQVVEYSPKRYRFDVFALRPGWQAPPLGKEFHATEMAAYGAGIEEDRLSAFLQAIQGQSVTYEDDEPATDWLAPIPKLAKKKKRY